MIRRIIGIVFALIAAWLLWQGLHAVQVIVSRGSPLGDALMQPPTSLWRIVAAGVALIGGLLVAAKLPGGGPVAAAGAVLFAALGGAMVAMGTDSSMWMDEVVSGGILIVLAGALLFLKRSQVQNPVPAD